MLFPYTLRYVYCKQGTQKPYWYNLFSCCSQ